MIKYKKTEDLQAEKVHNNILITRSRMLTYGVFTIIFIVTSFLSILFMFNHFSDNTSFLTFKSISPSILLYVAILLFFYFLFDGLRFFYVLKTMQISIDFKYIYKLSLINTFLSNITPFATGGAFCQIYFLNKKGISLGDATAISTIRSVLPIIFFFLATPIILIVDKNLFKIFPSEGNLIYVSLTIVLYLLAAYGFNKILKNNKIIKKIVYRLLYLLSNKKLLTNNKVKKLRRHFFVEIDRFTIDIRMFLNGKKIYVFLSIAFMLLYLFTLFTFPIILTIGLSSNISMLEIIDTQIILTFVTYFAPTPGATGVAEGGFTLIFSKFVSKADIVSLTFWWRFFTMYLGMLIGMIIFYLEIAKNKLKLN